jgi:outer membrane receptor protein involved in Fe transport
LDNILYYVDNIDGDIDEYYRYDLIISYKLDPNLRFSFAGKNLLEDEHQEYGASLYSNAVEVPRSYHLKIDYKF